MANTFVPEQNSLTQGAISNNELGHAARKDLDCQKENHTVAFHARWGKGTGPLGRRRYLSRSGNDVPGTSEVTSVKIISFRKEERELKMEYEHADEQTNEDVGAAIDIWF